MTPAKVRWNKRRRKWTVVTHAKGAKSEVSCASKGEAETVAGQINAGLTLGIDPRKARQPKAPSFQDYAAKWIAAPHGWKPSTLARHNSSLKLLPFKSLPVGYAEVREFRDGLLEVYAPNSVRNVMRTLSLILDEAEREGLGANPCRKLPRMKAGPRDKPNPFTATEVARLLAVFREHRPAYWEFALTLARTGMRIGEAVALRWDDVDFASRLIHVRRSKAEGHPVGKPKTQAGDRKVDMSGELQAALESLRKRRLAEELAGKRSALVFPNQRGAHLRHGNFRRRVWTWCLKKAGIAYRGPHQLRHTFASLLLMDGQPLAYVSAQLGHSSPNITLGVYTHWLPKERRERGVDALDEGRHHLRKIE